MAVWDGGAQPLPSGGSAARSRHIGRGPCFVDKDQTVRIKIELAVEPVFASLFYVRTLLFA